MAGVVDALVLQAEASDLGGGDTLANITRTEALKEKCENEFNEVKTTEDVPDSLSNAESSDPEDIRAPMSRESPSPCSHGKPRCSAKQRKGRSRQKKHCAPRMMETCHEPSSPRRFPLPVTFARVLEANTINVCALVQPVLYIARVWTHKQRGSSGWHDWCCQFGDSSACA